MGEHVLKEQLKNLKNRQIKTSATACLPGLFDRPDVLSQVFTTSINTGEQVQVGERLFACHNSAEKSLLIARSNRAIGRLDGEGAACLAEILQLRASGGIAQVEVVEVSDLSGTAKVRVDEGNSDANTSN